MTTQNAIEKLEHALGSPRNDDGTLWINGGLDSLEHICEQVLEALRAAQKVDVEGLKFDCTKNTADEGHIRVIFNVIDYLAATGRLAGIPKGYVLVPMEPTQAMLDNITDERGTVRILDFTSVEERSQPHLMSKAVYRAMIAAAEKE